MDSIRSSAQEEGPKSAPRSLPLAGEDMAKGAGAGAVFSLPKPGDVIAGKYRIEKVVGEGGMGIVYAAHHLVLDQRVALKLLLVDALRGHEVVERFVREAQAAARLRSEHVVRVTDAGALDDGLPFLVMEFLQGCDLAELLRLEGPLAPADVADAMLQALSALGQAHAAGIVHRDLKPANLFLAVRDDGSNLLKVLDFGISKQQSVKAQWKELTGKAVLGTPSYMSPEQLRSSKNVDARADIWSLGVVMYELLTGLVPFDGESPGEIFAAVLERTPAPMQGVRPDLAPEWDAVVSCCLARDPAQRFQDAASLAKALAPLGSGRWAHLVAAIDKPTIASASRLGKSGIALVEAAVAAAVSSLPPPRLLSRPSPERPSTFVTDKTMFADVVPSPRKASLGLLRKGGATAAIVAVAAAILLLIGRGPSRAPGRAVAGSPPSVHEATAASAVSDRPDDIAAPASDPTRPHEPAVFAEQAPTAISKVTAPATSAPPAEPGPAATEVKSAPTPPVRRGSFPGNKPGAGETRPKFLKSWR